MGSASVATVALSLSLLLIPALGQSAELRDHLYGVRALSATEAWAVGNFGTIEHTTDAGGFAVGANGFDARVDRDEVILSDGRRAATAAD